MAKLQCKVLADQIEAQQKQIDHLRQELAESSSGQDKVKYQRLSLECDGGTLSLTQKMEERGGGGGWGRRTFAV